MNKLKNYDNNFIEIQYIYYNDHDKFCPLTEQQDFIFIETNINPNYIIEITKPKLSNLSVKGYYSTYSRTIEKVYFTIFLSNNRKLYLLEDQYDKFKHLIYNNE